MTGPGEIERFRTAIGERLGLQFDDTRLGFLGDVLHRRLAKHGAAVEAYLCAFETSPAQAEIAALAQELTVGETYFFRYREQFRAFSETVLPHRMQANATSKVLRVLSAGCASGEEPYSLAIALREAIPDPGWDITVRAVDINPAALQRAARARYSSWSLRETSDEVRCKWFRPDGRDMILNEAARACVRFERGNLAVHDPILWQPQSFDVVFCRNVIMYFTAEQARALLARIARALRPGGYLFLGHAETLRGLSEAFHLRHSHNTFYYQLKEGADAAVEPSTQPAVGFVATDDVVPDAGATWVEIIRAASDRVAALVPPRQPAQTAQSVPQAGWDLTPAFQLLRGERFGEALAFLKGLPAATARDPDCLLLSAALLVHDGRPEAAEETCRALLLIDEFNAGAHYVFALCREAAGDRARAAEHDRAAAYLDPAFAMPRLHLGLLARRAGDRAGAQRELAQALVLLRREDASRLLLFGGGFNRSALLALCASALRECGGEP